MQAEQERADAERVKRELIAWVAEQQVLAAARDFAMNWDLTCVQHHKSCGQHTEFDKLKTCAAACSSA